MAITYDWHFPQLQVQYTSNSLADVVTELRWVYTGEVGGGEYHDGRVGILKVGPVAAASFVAYESLTKDLVTAWVTASLGDEYVTELETKIDSIDVVGTVATVRLESDNWTGHKFTDFFTLLKVEGTWKIMNKVFHLHA